MLDNYTPRDANVDAEKLKRMFPHVVIEVSGVSTVRSHSIADTAHSPPFCVTTYHLL